MQGSTIFCCFLQVHERAHFQNRRLQRTTSALTIKSSRRLLPTRLPPPCTNSPGLRWRTKKKKACTACPPPSPCPLPLPAVARTASASGPPLHLLRLPFSLPRGCGGAPTTTTITTTTTVTTTITTATITASCKSTITRARIPPLLCPRRPPPPPPLL